MTNKLEQLVSTGIITRPQAVFAYGLEGTRKTGSMVSPNSLIIDLERGSDQYDVARISVGTYSELIQALDLVINEKSAYEVIVVDPVEIAEKLLIGETCRQLKIESLQGLPHGSAWIVMRELFDAQFMARFEQIRRGGRHICIVGHSQVRTCTLPGLADPFDRWEPRLDKRNADSLTEWADHVLFYNWDLRTAKSRDGTVRAIAGREPIIHVIHGPGWNAKNRVGLTEPIKPEFAALAPLFANHAAAQETPPAPAPHTDSRTRQPLPNPDEAMTDPFLSDEERRTVEAFLAELPQERLLAFLRERNLIKADEDYHMLGPHFLRRVLADRDGFKEAVGSA